MEEKVYCLLPKNLKKKYNNTWFFERSRVESLEHFYCQSIINKRSQQKKETYPFV